MIGKRFTERPAVGTRVMHPYGRKNYVDYGLVGTVISHDDSRDGRGFTVLVDDYQPFAKWCFGSKAKADGHEKERKTFTFGELESVAEVYRGNAQRFREIAEQWDKNAEYEEKR